MKTNSQNFNALNDSCKQLQTNECNHCSWTTCYNDIFFIQELMKKMRNHHEIDESKVVIIGGSNGGMFVNRLAGHVKASHFIPLYGNPPSEHYPSPDSSDVSHFLAYHGRNDREVPMDCGESKDHYNYMSQNETMSTWADVYSMSNDKDRQMKQR